jgi:hypothetical protein
MQKRLTPRRGPFCVVRPTREPSGCICERPKLQQREATFPKGLVLQDKAGFS